MQSEWLDKDYYRVLGVAETATEKEIQRAYRRLARELHPDANPGKPEAEERFKEVSAAYDVLGDAAKRTEYDRVRRLGPAGRPEGGFSFSTDGDDFAAFDLGDLLGGLFGQTRASAARRGADLQAELSLGFEEAVHGTTTEVVVTGESPRPVKVRIPAGVDDGQLVRLPGLGAPGRNGGPPGDLFVLVRVGPHPVFGRSGRDLTLTLPVTYPEAALGAEVQVPVLDGPPVTLRIPAGTPAGRTLRVRGKGVKSGRHRGDLLVRVEVAVPQRLSAAERRAVQALADVAEGDPRAHLHTPAASTA
ncbi:MAG TPA: DnaJ C-terminal domain-containing protein [Acidimicrobiales bacterium]|nr:DnaJ C-terminal domain-containing protein [Acidimicrobiales bacterium]